ncbi:MAG: adenine phosphoribosyltransferase [Propionibacteriaceae bacterium]
MAPTTQEERIALVASLIRDVPDFPKPGVVYKDITPLLANHAGYKACIDALVEAAPADIDVVVGMEARGFVFAAPVALALGVGFVPVRKSGKLPMDVYSESFSLEYGSDTLAIHRDAIQPHTRVLVIDDVLATGGTVGATSRLIRQLGADLVHVSVVMELGFLHGRANLESMGVSSVGALITV